MSSMSHYSNSSSIAPSNIPSHPGHNKKPVMHMGMKKQHKITINSPKQQRDLFADLPHNDTLVPPAIPAWSNVNLTIKRRDVVPQKRLILAPDPGLFFSLKDKTCQMPMLQMWYHLQNALRALKLHNCVYALDAQILAQACLDKEKNAVHQELCQANVDLLRRIADLESSCILEDLRQAYDMKCQELLEFSNDSTKLLVKLTHRNSMLDLELSSLRKEVHRLRIELTEVDNELFNFTGNPTEGDDGLSQQLEDTHLHNVETDLDSLHIPS
ncbi:hypothetical protein GYMLUDRAFT_251153 [Collybiopsis luxurians FD-317 M1]|uniref:Uncharacterized protein n=1 Tax=Collybiopsis luxurians FD-317 M1 TaxID=944289 RepID=A0A0D0BDI3_9AGAR|nr:hypothetical protein GYMLUDRAFT_251153 [Collybiopsis luxurians FD-317 M1]